MTGKNGKLMSSIIFVEDAYDIEKIKSSEDGRPKIFSLNFTSHELLEKANIPHEISESYVSLEDKINTFDTAVKLREWYKKHPDLDKLKFNKINLIELFDINEFHQFLIELLSKIIILKRIIEKFKPKKITVSEKLKHIIESIPTLSNIQIEIFPKSTKKLFYFDEYQINYKIGPVPISFNISRKKLVKLKHWYEKIATIQNFWYDEQKSKNGILFLEFDPTRYEELFNELHKLKIQIILLNRRKSAMWNSKAISIIKKYNCKIINENELLSKNKEQIIKNTKFYEKEFQNFWSNDQFFNGTFEFQNCHFGKAVKESLIQVYQNRLNDYIKLVLLSEQLLNKKNFSSIISLYTIGETENSILKINKNKIQTVLLEHGYANFVDEVSRYDVFHMYYTIKNNDKLAVWGNIQKNYLQKNRNFSDSQLLNIGSPRHDSFFRIKKTKNNIKKQILILPSPFENYTGLTDTNTVLKYKKTIENIVKILKNLNVEIIVKLHPAQDISSKTITEFFKNTDKNIKIFQNTPISNHLKSSDAVIHIEPHGIGLSTSILESLILKIPTMNIIINNKIFEFDCVKKNAIMTFLDSDDLQNPIRDLIFNQNIRDDLIKNAEKHIHTYLVNAGNASSALARSLNSIM